MSNGKKGKISGAAGINAIIIAIRMICFITMISLLILVQNIRTPLTFEIALWISVGLMAVVVILEAWQTVNETEKISVYFVYTIIFGIALGILAILGSVFKWADRLAPIITLSGFIAILIIGALFIGQLILSLLGSKQVNPTKQKGDQQYAQSFVPWTQRFKITIKRQRFTTTFLLLIIGIVVIATGGQAKLSWIWNYLIPILLMLPFAIVLVLELTDKTAKFDKAWFKATGLFYVLIEGAIMVVIFVLSVYVIWNVLPVGFQSIWEYDSWITISYGFMIGIGLIIHAFWGTRRIYTSEGIFGSKAVGYVPTGPIKSNKGMASAKDGDDTYPKPHYLGVQCILLILLITNIYYTIRLVKDIIDNGISIETGVLMVIAAFILIILLEWIEEEYLKFNLVIQRIKGKTSTPNWRRAYSWETIIIIPLFVIIIIAAILRAMPREAYFVVIITILIGFMIMLYPNIHTEATSTEKPSGTEVSTPADARPKTEIVAIKTDGITVYHFTKAQK
jgi:hypothetical protein